MFDLEKFKTPDAVNTPGYFWLWNGEMTEEKIFEQLEDMASLGAKSVCLHPMPSEFRANMMTKLSPDYLSEDFFRIHRKAVDKCAELGMHCYLYDEGGWPSGGACGRVLAADPENYKRYFLSLDGNGNVVRSSPQLNPSSANMPDNLNREATGTFIKLTHENYERHLGEHLGGTILFAFTDEPQLGITGMNILPWTPGFEEEFQKRKGYDISLYIRDILQSSASTSPDAPRETALKRLDYYDVYSQLFVERFLAPIQKWCRSNGMLSAGHFSGEDEWFNPGMLSFGALMRSLRALDVPGVDAIWNQLYPGRRLHPFPKLASSAAAQTGSRYVMAEVFCVYGSGLTPAVMRYVTDFLFVCGINIFVLASYPYDTSDGNVEGCRPHCSRIDPLHDFKDILHNRISRLSHVFTRYAPVVKTALFFDQRSLWTGGRKCEYSAVNQLLAAERLLDNYCDFDYIDDDVLRDGKAADGQLSYGCVRYDRIVLPDDAEISPAAAANLEKMKREGVTVLNSREWSKIPPLLQTDAPAGQFRIRKLSDGTAALYFIMNITESYATASFTAGEKADVLLCDPETGGLYALPESTPGSWRYTFAPGSGTLFLLSSTPEAYHPAETVPGDEVMRLDRGWRAAPVLRTVAGSREFETEVIPCEFIEAGTGDWQKYFGDDFSGKVIYQTEFEWNHEQKDYFLDLGKVNYAAQVKINGRDAGRTFFPPHILPVSSFLRPGKNILEITVANTLANAVAPERVLDHWQETLPYMTYYEILQRKLERESIPSGLFGPVRILKGKFQ